MRLLRLLLSYVAFALALPFLAAHPKLRGGFWTRLGYVQGLSQPKRRPRVWIHGASAGDVLALAPLARELKGLRQDCEIIVSTITNSGREMAERTKAAFDGITYLPYDLAGPIARTLTRLSPDVLVLEYTELWPELVHQAHARGVKLVLHNGRFAEERLDRYRWLFRFTGNLLQKFDLLLMRDEFESDRALALGAAEDRTHVTGNTKFDNVAVDVPEAKVQELRHGLALPSGAPVWVCGSTHDGEEETLLTVFQALRERRPDLVLVIAPRYLERAQRVVALAEKRGLKTRLRSSPPAPADVIVLDTIGELSACYGVATLVFVGGSFVLRGGQNILEPAAGGKAVLFGPHMENFTDAVLVLLGRGGIQVSTPEQLERVLKDLLERQPYRDELGALARQQVLSVRGAAKRNAELIARVLPRPYV